MEVTSLPESISLMALISLLNLLSATLVVDEMASTTDILSTTPRILIFSGVFHTSARTSLRKIAFSKPSQRLRASAAKVDLTTLLILFDCQS